VKLLTYSNPKIVKSNKFEGYLTAVLHLAPALKSGFNVCNHRSVACTKLCLDETGHGGIGERETNPVHKAREARTHMFFMDRPSFNFKLAKEIDAHARKAAKASVTPANRLNATSDIPWERVKFGGKPNIMACYPGIQWYDYTKYPYRSRPEEKLPTNYHLTFSHDEDTTMAEMMDNLMHGRNVAVVFRQAIPETWFGIPVIDGDKHDMRFLDSKGVIVGLKAKGKAKKDTSGFVV
jgi:hypothetical protein